jgi:hypothetical protein
MHLTSTTTAVIQGFLPPYNKLLASSIHEPAVARTVEALKRMFTHQDSKWVDMVLDHMNT